MRRTTLSDGRDVVIKPGDATAEAAGLRWIRVDGGPPVPDVLEATRDRLVVAYVEQAAPTPAAAGRFGRELAVMHAAGAPSFGAPPPGGSADATIGMASMRNVPAPDWPAWYVADRVLPYLSSARDAGGITAGDAAAVEQVCACIDELAGPAQPPARLHGDLWSGNVLWTSSTAALIDPAAHGGHRETDLAMLALFGCAHLDVVLDAYGEAARLDAGWRRRVPLHQLFPLLVHATLFGGGYGRQAGAAARDALDA